MMKGATVLLSERPPTPSVEEVHGVAVPRLSEILAKGDAKCFRTIAALPSNIEAVEAALLFSAGLESRVAIVGPSGWGKSHLLEAVASRLRAESGMPVPQAVDVEDWLGAYNRGGRAGAAIVENVQACMSGRRRSQMLRVALERRVKANRPTLLSFTARGPSRQIRALLPQPHTWVIAHLRAPIGPERESLLRHMAFTEGLALSEELLKFIAGKTKGNGCTLMGALKRLKAHQNRWVSASETLRACGVLNPFFADDGSWDLRDHIVKVVARQGAGALPSPLDVVSAAAYLMLREAMLSEADVADYLKLEPKNAYGLAGRLERLRNDDARVSEALKRLISDVVGALQTE
jgi:energy-coupling factor transporter ATP-binding protein EcfA2